MTKEIDTEKNRRYLFVLMALLGLYGHQLYYNHNSDRAINEALEAHNKTYVRAVQVNTDIREEMKQWVLAAEYWRAMYYGVKDSNVHLEGQINTINNYWKKEYLKVSEELFDVKNIE